MTGQQIETGKRECELAQWRPISTAPTDGTPVIVCREGSKTVEIAAHARGNFRGNPWRERFYFGRIISAEPTHWMPLPNPPASKEVHTR